MASTYKILAQSNPSGSTNTDMYTVPASTMAVCSTMVVCNFSSSSTPYRIAVRTGGAVANQNYLVYDNYVNQYDSVFLTFGCTLSASSIVTVYASGSSAASPSNLSFSLFGSEIT